MFAITESTHFPWASFSLSHSITICMRCVLGDSKGCSCELVYEIFPLDLERILHPLESTVMQGAGYCQTRCCSLGTMPDTASQGLR